MGEIMMWVQCPWCGTWFFTRYGKFCSRGCCKKYHKLKEQMILKDDVKIKHNRYREGKW